MKKHFTFLTALLFSVAALAQSEQRSAKNFVSAKIMTTTNSDNVEFTISKSGESINVTASGGKAKMKANNPLRGKIIFGPGVAETFGSTESVGVKGVKIVMGKDPGGQPVKSITLGVDGKFEFTDVPVGTYQLMLGGKLIAISLKIRGE